MPPSQAETEVKNELRKVKVLVVRSLADGFRRIGLAFTREATHLDQKLLTASQINTLKSEPNLAVSETTVVVAGAAPEKATTAADAVVVPVPSQQSEDTTASK